MRLSPSLSYSLAISLLVHVAALLWVAPDYRMAWKQRQHPDDSPSVSLTFGLGASSAKTDPASPPPSSLAQVPLPKPDTVPEPKTEPLPRNKSQGAATDQPPQRSDQPTEPARDTQPEMVSKAASSAKAVSPTEEVEQKASSHARENDSQRPDDPAPPVNRPDPPSKNESEITSEPEGKPQEDDNVSEAPEDEPIGTPRMATTETRRRPDKINSGEPALVEPLNAPVIEYPALAKRRRLEGTVIIKGVLNPQGRLNDAEILESSGHAILDESALVQAKDWQYRAQGHDMGEQTIHIPVVFRLK